LPSVKKDPCGSSGARVLPIRVIRAIRG